MPIEELKHIVATQKTVSTSRLAILVKRVEEKYIQQGQKINRQTTALRKASKQIKREKEKAARLRGRFDEQ
ncbi:hypothetical protein [Psychrobacillus sp.]|uniref:hypothetical protein n=1 Tax=Psychrobacillus sp. TaxID=1871623 RepID=UPI0028BD1A21|nr:hypothetical protein [Psychrobacillus sp.]